jgi:hypothetical protein
MPLFLVFAVIAGAGGLIAAAIAGPMVDPAHCAQSRLRLQQQPLLQQPASGPPPPIKEEE